MAFFVRKEGLEPPRLSAPDPKSGAATNYATCALFLQLWRQIYSTISLIARFLRKILSLIEF